MPLKLAELRFNACMDALVTETRSPCFSGVSARDGPLRLDVLLVGTRLLALGQFALDAELCTTRQLDVRVGRVSLWLGSFCR